jgi:coenzyme F420-reducing hydrogenase delta subunit
MSNDGRTTVAATTAGSKAMTGRTLTVFVCANCARGGLAPTSAGRARPTVPAFGWPCAAREVLVPCSGRLQPEHLLKAFETGADVVGVIACQPDNCHHVEGSCRAQRRIDYTRGLLDQIGLGGGRLMLFHLPGTAREDMALGLPATGTTSPAAADLAAQVQTIVAEVTANLQKLTPNPLREAALAAEGAQGPYEMEEADESDE